MHRVAAVAAVCSLIAACAGTIKEEMTKLGGQPLSAAVSKIGPPVDERTIAGKKVYIWGFPELSSKGTKEKQCQIRATMNGDVIGSLDYEGDDSLCQRYAARLRRGF